MNQFRFTSVCFLAAFLFAGEVFGQPAAECNLTGQNRARTADCLMKLPLFFEQNKGQVNPEVKYLSRGNGFAFFLTPGEAVLSLAVKDDKTGENGRENAVLRMRLIGAGPNPEITGENEQEGKVNYFKGEKMQNKCTDIPLYSAVRYEDVYQGIDALYYGSQGRFEYDFIVKPGADPARIRLLFEGADKVFVDKKGDLVIRVKGKEIKQHKPIVYQKINGKKNILEGSYVVRGGNRVCIAVNKYDKTIPLVIDPVISFSTYLGGSDTDCPSDIFVDAGGNVFIGGMTTSLDFPIAGENPLQVTSGFGNDAFVPFIVKIDPEWTTILYSAYFEPHGCRNMPFAITVDSAGNLYSALSDGAGPGKKVIKFNPEGNEVVYLIYIRPGYNIDSVTDMAVDINGNAFVTGATAFSDLDGTQGSPIQSEILGAYDGFITKIDPSGNILWSTYIGGSNMDIVNGIAIDGAGDIYVTGDTNSPDFIGTNRSDIPVIKDTYEGGDPDESGHTPPDAFVAKIRGDGSAIVYSTYLGGIGMDSGLAIAVDEENCAYITGCTKAVNFLLNADVPPIQPELHGGMDAFVTKISPDGSRILFSTYLGGFDEDSGGYAHEIGRSIAVDAKNIYIAGSTESLSFPGITDYSLSRAKNAARSGFISIIDREGLGIVDSTFIGGSGVFGDDCEAIAANAGGCSIYAVGVTTSVDFPGITGSSIQSEIHPIDQLIVIAYFKTFLRLK